ncbi:MAG: tRNA-dihydrouridine synthase, partial [Pseudomonadota bacterium]
LNGLSPKQNREVPPLDYGRVRRLKTRRPDLQIIINGGVLTAEQALALCRDVDGVMIGRAAYQNPFMLIETEEALFGRATVSGDRHDVVARMLPYIDTAAARGVPLHAVTRHMLGLFQGQPGARAWRRHLSENSCRAGANSETVQRALELVRHAETSLRSRDRAA